MKDTIPQREQIASQIGTQGRNTQRDLSPSLFIGERHLQKKPTGAGVGEGCCRYPVSHPAGELAEEKGPCFKIAGFAACEDTSM